MSDVQNLKKLVKALDDLVKVGEAIAADGKVDFSDAAHLPRLVAPVQDLYEAVSAKDELVDELRAWADAKLDELKA